MPAQQFPDPTPESIGQFAIVDSNGECLSPTRTGVLRVKDNRVTLEVSPEFNSSIEWEERDDGSWVGRSPGSEPDDFVVLGSLATQPSSVSLWGVNTTGRRSLGFSRPDRESPGNHEMRVDYCLVGDHVSNRDTGFTQIELKVTNLHDWAGIATTTMTLPRGGRGPRSWTLDLPNEREVPLISPPGTIKLTPQATIAAPSFSGFKVSTSTKAVITLGTGVQLPEILSGFAIPFATLMTLLSGYESSIRGARLMVGADVGVDLYGYQIDPAAHSRIGDLLLRRVDVDGDFLPKWLDLFPTVSPVPQILAAAWGGEFATVDAEALTLATVAEMLHRRLHPDSRRFSEAQVADARVGILAADMPAEVRQSFITALDGWWAESSYPQRLRELAEPVAEAVPRCVGKINRWTNAVREQRVAAAHGLDEAESSRPDIGQLYALTLSLRWMLTLRLLLAVGVTPAQLKHATDRSERFASNARMWTRQRPDIFDQQSGR